MIYTGDLLPDDYGHQLTAAVYIRLRRAAEKQHEERNAGWREIQDAQKALKAAEDNYRRLVGLDNEAQAELAHYTKEAEEE